MKNFSVSKDVARLRNHKNNEKSSDYYKTEINHNNVYIKYTTTLTL